ncbi:type IV pilus modification PilV family protein [Polyangium jinanense]|uniref:Prepilin-type N-terminal cleavage/methylation domain-containing protein n=1 Tax=Polyangium jinanense TaxID=2829994 RepID=A0A9X4APZ1_9BACT|nr:prepilin-type N-terminal cleavage/methylation domain-containing protein [Polyangium jinanense]MDC3952921.1 prepilin-type N-terminal cleavage/methylation domain-containing protein [Polyangium jinanense]MDC3980539.1 prepilin-type N-terminal cleavage/methylation domain-containing protein [Polyangium jinanense]
MKRRGFTLLEVMVAVAILGLGLTAILSAQAGAFSASSHARNLSVATSLARCKMGEIEETLFREGFQELEVIESGPCCEGDETPNLKCSWKIEKPQFPEPKLGEMELDTGLDLSSPQNGGANPSGASGAAGGLGAMGGLLGLAGGATPPATGDLAGGGLGDVAGALGGATGADALGGMLQLVGTFVYPALKAIFEMNTRRVTLTVTWTEGTREHSFDVVQWVTNPKPTLVTNDQLDAVDALMNPTGGSNSTGGGNLTGGGPTGGGNNPFGGRPTFPGGGMGR